MLFYIRSIRFICLSNCKSHFHLNYKLATLWDTLVSCSVSLNYLLYQLATSAHFAFIDRHDKLVCLPLRNVINLNHLSSNPPHKPLSSYWNWLHPWFWYFECSEFINLYRPPYNQKTRSAGIISNRNLLTLQPQVMLHKINSVTLRPRNP